MDADKYVQVQGDNAIQSQIIGLKYGVEDGG